MPSEQILPLLFSVFTEDFLSSIQVRVIDELRSANLASLRNTREGLSQHVVELSACLESVIATHPQSQVVCAQVLGQVKSLTKMVDLGIERVLHEQRRALSGSDHEPIIRILLNGPATIREIREKTGDSMQMAGKTIRHLESLRLCTHAQVEKEIIVSLTDDAMQLAKRLGIEDHDSYIDKYRKSMTIIDPKVAAELNEHMKKKR
jgi:hypothetical protein